MWGDRVLEIVLALATAQVSEIVLALETGPVSEIVLASAATGQGLV